MGEYVSSHDIPNADLATAGALGSVTREVTIPISAVRWTFLVVPKNTAGAPPDPNFALEYGVDGTFYPANPPTGPTPVVKNAVNILTKENVVNLVRVKITNGATLIDGDVLIRFYIAR